MRGREAAGRILVRLTVVSAVLALLGATGCGQDGGRRTRPGGVNPGLSVPYVVGEPVPNPPVTALFARSPWLVVDPGSDQGVYRPVPKAAPTVLGTVLDGRDAKISVLRGIADLAEGAGKPFREPVFVEADELRHLDIVAPSDYVWLFGIEGPCRARVGRPMVAAYHAQAEVWEVSWTLQQCHGTQWAPVGLIAEQIPADMRWVPAQTVAEVELDATQVWDHPLGGLIEVPQDDAATPGGQVIWALAAEGLRPEPTTVLHTVWSGEGSEEPCTRQRQTNGAHAMRQDEALQLVLPLPDAQDPAVLAGAIAQEDRPQAIVYAEGLHAWVAVPPAPTVQELRDEGREQDAQDVERGVDPGPPQWTSIELSTGVYHPTDRAAARYTAGPTECLAPPPGS